METRYERILLDNGLEVILYPIKEIQSIYAGCYVRSANLYASSTEIGLAHFLEHLSFCSTHKYKERKTIAQALNKIGAYANAQTSTLLTNYWIKSPSITMNDAIDVLYQLIFKINIFDEEIEKEKKVILNEYRDFLSNENSVFAQKVLENRFLNLPQYQLKPMGNEEILESINKQKLKEWRDRFINPSNMILSVAGNFDQKKILAKIRNSFGLEIAGKKVGFPIFQESNYSNLLFYHEDRKSNQVWFELTWPTFGWKEKTIHDELVLAIMNYILGVGPMSRLNFILRERLNITYHVNSFSYLYPSLGYMGISCSVNKDDFIRALTAINKIIRSLKEKGVTQKELEATRSYFNFQDLMSYETAESIANYYGRQIFDYGRIWEPRRYSKERDKITVDETSLMANKVFDYSRLNINIRGDLEKGQMRKIKELGYPQPLQGT